MVLGVPDNDRNHYKEISGQRFSIQNHEIVTLLFVKPKIMQ